MKLFTLIAICLFSLPSYSENKILISKEQMTLWVIDSRQDTIFKAPIGCGVNYGNKRKVGDMRTPEGSFKICQIQNATAWTHDFKDGHGVRQGAYGPYFLRLSVPNNRSIGIHGTCFPESIGTRCSEGCVRMHNEDVKKLRQLITVGTPCTILPDKVQHAN